MIELPRRRFLAGLVGLIAAPAVVKAASLMPVKAFADGLDNRFLEPKDWRYSEEIQVRIKGFVPRYGSYDEICA